MDGNTSYVSNDLCMNIFYSIMLQYMWKYKHVHLAYALSMKMLYLKLNKILPIKKKLNFCFIFENIFVSDY